jgi:hypothetical protein
MAKVRAWQAVFLLGVIVGIALAAGGNGLEVFGVGMTVVCLVLFFVLVGIVGWVKQGARGRS